MAIAGGNRLTLLSRNGRDRTALFREPFRALADAGLPGMLLDGEIAVPDERGVTHIDALSKAITGFIELGAGRFDAITVAEERAGQLVPTGTAKFGLAGRGLWHILDELRIRRCPTGHRAGAIEPEADIKHFGRHQRGWIRDALLLRLHRRS